MQIRAAEISDVIRDQIKQFEKQLEVRETGMVLSAGDGIARIYGLENAGAGELRELEHGAVALAFNLEEANSGSGRFGGCGRGIGGEPARRTRRTSRLPVCSALRGRVV